MINKSFNSRVDNNALAGLFHGQAKNVTSGALILGISYLISAVLGLIRDGLLMGKFGTGPEADVYFAAFRIPDFVYNVLILGGLIVAFLPLFAEYFSRNRDDAWEMANYVLNAVVFSLVLTSLVFFIFSPFLIKWLFPKFGPEQVKLAIPLVRLLFLSPIFFGISNLLSGILQYFNRFLIYSLTPILYNLGIIFGILALSPAFGILGVGMGVALGAFFHMAVQIPSAIKSGFRYKPLLNLKHPALKRIFKLMVPRVFGVAAQQINLIFITSIASFVSMGSIAVFNFSNNLQGLPIGIIGVSFAVAIFPVLSKNWSENNKSEFVKNFYSAFRQILFLIIPLSAIFFVFRIQIIEIVAVIGRYILGTSRFGPPEISLVAACLGIFSLSLFAQSLIPLYTRAFFSLQDTKTPTLIAVLSVILNIALSFYFIKLFSLPGLSDNFIYSFFRLQGEQNIAVLGLPLAFSLSAIFQFALAAICLKKKLKNADAER